MSWLKDTQTLICDHTTPTGGPRAADVDMVACRAYALGSTAAVARSKARATGWETNAATGDRCGQHRVTRPRTAHHARARS